jgi:hypothetical protein
MGKNARYRKLRSELVATAIKEPRWETLTPSEQRSLVARTLRKVKRADQQGQGHNLRKDA